MRARSGTPPSADSALILVVTIMVTPSLNELGREHTQTKESKQLRSLPSYAPSAPSAASDASARSASVSLTVSSSQGTELNVCTHEYIYSTAACAHCKDGHGAAASYGIIRNTVVLAPRKYSNYTIGFTRLYDGQGTCRWNGGGGRRRHRSNHKEIHLAARGVAFVQVQDRMFTIPSTRSSDRINATLPYNISLRDS